MRFRLSRAAERDLENIGDWIARDDPDVAAGFTADLAQKAREIATAPFMYPSVSGKVDYPLRKRSYRRHIIYYRVGRTVVTVVRILRHSRDQGAHVRTP